MDHPEDQIQKAVADHLRLRGVRGLVWWHTPNGAQLGGKRNRKGIAIQGARMKGLGVRPGVSDIIAVYAGRIYALELKSPTGVATDAQRQFLIDMEAQGATVALTKGIDEPLAALERWGLFRRNPKRAA